MEGEKHRDNILEPGIFPVDIEKPGAGEEGQGGRDRFSLLFGIKPAQGTSCCAGREGWGCKTLCALCCSHRWGKGLCMCSATGISQQKGISSSHLRHKQQQELPWAPRGQLTLQNLCQAPRAGQGELSLTRDNIYWDALQKEPNEI